MLVFVLALLSAFATASDFDGMVGFGVCVVVIVVVGGEEAYLLAPAPFKLRGVVAYLLCVVPI